jgi:UDP-glucose 4-epimerase
MVGVPGHKIYNLGSGTGYSVREVIEAAGKATGRSIPFLETSRRSGDPASLLADISNAYKELGWIPQLDINDIVRDAWLSFESEVAW